MTWVYGDVQCLNPERGKIATPHMDQVAADGMTFYRRPHDVLGVHSDTLRHHDRPVQLADQIAVACA